MNTRTPEREKFEKEVGSASRVEATQSQCQISATKQWQMVRQQAQPRSPWDWQWQNGTSGGRLAHNRTGLEERGRTGKALRIGDKEIWS